MKSKTAVILSIILVFPCFLFNLSCTTQVAGGSGTDEGHSRVVGTLYEPCGKRVAINADVRMRLASVLADTTGTAQVDAAFGKTDTGGRYSFNNIDTGIYVVEGSDSANNRALIEGVRIASKDSIKTLGPDTLKPAGAIKGIIKLSEGGDPRKVLIFSFGIDRFTRVNADGSFLFPDLARGTYTLRVLPLLPDYGVCDTGGIVVKSSDTTDIGLISPRFTGIPTPKNVKISYDTLKQIVTLRWSKADTALAKGYNVYRRNIDSNIIAVKIHASPAADTAYRDSTAVQDQTYEYSVAAVNKNAAEGGQSATVNVKIISAFKLIRTYGNGKGSGQGMFAGLRAVAVDDSGKILCVDCGNNRIQEFDTSGAFVRQWGTQGNSDGQFNKPWDIEIDSLGNLYIVDSQNDRIQKFDRNGNFLLKWGSSGTSDGMFSTPYQIAIHKAFVYVGDWIGQRVQKFDLNGNFQMSIPVGLPVDGVAADDSFTYAISNNTRIIKFSVTGSSFGAIYTTGKESDGVTDLKINGLCLSDVDNVIYVSNLTKNAIFGMDPSGAVLFRFGITNGLDSPQDVWVSGKSVFVAIYNGYIQEYIRQ